jgi:hypothetical protein
MTTLDVASGKLRIGVTAPESGQHNGELKPYSASTNSRADQ